ncbi:GHMP family kinase ATP-binding protein [Aliirhizobium smilacinae]|uniref:GHMP family kinase ATP-binding protein n=1 Tax=Aliirhizobium smilacinae TaxID=1395944 RepID=UPI0015D65D69|nr:kinase [Rhizobium smilacinae]
MKAAELTLKLIKESIIGGDLTIDSNIPPGSGFGSSTADVIATIRAVADFAQLVLPRDTVSRIAVDAEIASDSLAYGDQPVLFGHRSGALIETFEGDYPRLVIVGFDTGDPPVATDEFAPARYSPEEIETFSILRALAARAIRSGDAAALGRVSSVSAEMNQRHLPISRFADIVKISGISGALGVQVAHSGNVAGLVFGAGERDQVDAGRRILHEEGFGKVIEFDVFAAPRAWS